MNSGQAQNNVPKFASFKPKPKSGTNQVTKAPVGLANSRHGEDRERKEHRRAERRDGAKSLKEVRRPQTPVTDTREALLDTWDTGQEIYGIDRKGDSNNVSYGSADKYAVPPYRRSGAGQVLGLAEKLRIDRNASDHAKLVLKDEHNRVTRENHPLAKHPPKPSSRLRLVPVRDADSDSELDNDFVSLRPSKRRKVSTGVPSDSEDVRDYRSIEGKAKERAVREDPDLQSVSGSSDDDLPSDDHEARQKNIQLSRQVKADPKDVDAWLALISHQDVLIWQGRDRNTSDLSSAERRSNAEVKLAMYQQALRNVDAKSTNHERLLLGMMETGAEVWEPTKLSAKWNEIVEQNRNNFALWIEFLNFEQTNFSTFRYEHCRNKFRDCVNAIKESLSTDPCIPAKPGYADKVHEHLIYVIWRATRLTYEAGFHEQAIAIWQALLEYNLFRPEFTNVPSNDDRRSLVNSELRNTAFQQFWESEVPRVGEEGALGWAAFAASTDAWRAPETRKPYATLSRSPDGFGSWAKIEDQRECELRYPGRSSDDEEEDIYHVVLYSDICDFLVDFPTKISRSLLLDAFLCFCGAPPLPSDGYDTAGRSWRRDPFLRNEMLDQSNTPITESLWRTMADEGASATTDTTTLSNELITTDYLFDPGGSRGLKAGENPLSVDAAWLLQILKSLNRVLPAHDGLAEYLLAFEAQSASTQPGSARKTAKRLLKERPQSIPLYNAYALLEAISGNNNVSEHVLFTAIKMGQAFGKSGHSDTVALWRTWVWQGLHCDREDFALRRLLAMAEPAAEILKECLAGTQVQTSNQHIIKENLAVNPAAVLKAKRTLTESLRYTVSNSSPYHAVLCAECLGLLAYLTASPGSDNLGAALSSFSMSSAIILSRDLRTANELLEQAKCRLIQYHLGNTHSYKPAVIRDALAKSIHNFPDNTLFLSMFAAAEARFRIDDRVRGILRDVSMEAEERHSIVQWFFLIEHEIRRGLSAGATQHSVRAVFQRAVESPTGKHSAVLWRLYVLWEIACLCSASTASELSTPAALSIEQVQIRAKTAGAQKVKAVFLSGLRQLPWCKRYMMLAFRTPLLQVLTLDEKRMVYDVLGEKELRFHVEIPQKVLDGKLSE